MKGTGVPPITPLERAELQKLRKEHDKLKKKFESQTTIAAKKASKDSDASSDEDVRY